LYAAHKSVRRKTSPANVTRQQSDKLSG